jgi:hypothetical protein
MNEKAGPFLALPSLCHFPCCHQAPQQTWLHGDEI